MKIQTINPSERDHDKVNSMITHAAGGRVDYDEIARQYNAVSVGSLLLIKLSASVRLGNIAKVLRGRGVEKGTDYLMIRPNVDAKGHPIPENARPVMIKKLTDTTIGLKKVT